MGMINIIVIELRMKNKFNTDYNKHYIGFEKAVANYIISSGFITLKDNMIIGKLKSVGETVGIIELFEQIPDINNKELCFSILGIIEDSSIQIQKIVGVYIDDKRKQEERDTSSNIGK